MKKIINIKKGFTLVEILLVVGFIALAGIGIYTVYSKVQMSNAALQEGKNLDTIRAGVKNLFGGSQNYSALSSSSVGNAVLNDARITPDSMRAIPYVAGDNKIVNSFGGQVGVVKSSLGTGTDNGFSVTYPQVPGAVCAKLVTGAGTGWAGAAIRPSARSGKNLQADAPPSTGAPGTGNPWRGNARPGCASGPCRYRRQSAPAGHRAVRPGAHHRRAARYAPCDCAATGRSGPGRCAAANPLVRQQW